MITDEERHGRESRLYQWSGLNMEMNMKMGMGYGMNGMNALVLLLLLVRGLRRKGGKHHYLELDKERAPLLAS